MKSTIRLTRLDSDSQELPEALRQAWPVTVLAEGTNMDDHVFVYHVGKADDPIQGDKFECVASVNQMHELPKTQGVSLTTETGIPFYRSNVLEYVCRSAEEAERIWKEVVNQVQMLVRNWNSALRMKGTAFAVISEELATMSDFSMSAPIRRQISYHPAGIAAVADGKQIISSPRSSMQGWLPIWAMATSTGRPPGALFFYNLPMDPDLQAQWPLKEPLSGHQLHRNGLCLPYGICWSLTQEGLWWLDFDPISIPGYQRQSPQANDGRAPWPTDYVSPSSPGAVPNLIFLTLFK